MTPNRHATPQVDALPYDAAAACREACIVTPAVVIFRGGEVLCRCVRPPNLGVHRLPRTSSPATMREPEELGQRHPQALPDEPGATAEDAAVSGLAHLVTNARHGAAR